MTKTPKDRSKLHPGGRPIEYKPEYAKIIRSEMARGYSLTAAIASIGFSRQTAYEWQDKHPEFSYACKEGQSLRQRFWEEKLMEDTMSARITANIFALKNTGTKDWCERQEVESTSTVKLDVSSLTDAELEKLVAQGG